jgi:mannose-6-phosphate isomerase-like protein (cupin superfamily)
MQLDRITERPMINADGTLLVGEWTLEAPADGAEPTAISQPHFHPDDDEAWYVVEGRLSVKLGDESMIVSAGGAAIATAGTTHTLANPGPRPCRYLIIAHRASRRRWPWQWLQRARRPRRIASVSRADAARVAAEIAARTPRP